MLGEAFELFDGLNEHPVRLQKDNAIVIRIPLF